MTMSAKPDRALEPRAVWPSAPLAFAGWCLPGYRFLSGPKPREFNVSREFLQTQLTTGGSPLLPPSSGMGPSYRGVTGPAPEDRCRMQPHCTGRLRVKYETQIVTAEFGLP